MLNLELQADHQVPDILMTQTPARNLNRALHRKPPSEINTNRYEYLKRKLPAEV
jgi:hypothetical protein